MNLRILVAVITLMLAAPGLAQAQPTPSPTLTPAMTPESAALPTVLTLVDAQKIALAKSPALDAARGALDQAQASIGIATSGALPNLSGQASTDYSKGSVRSSGGGAGTFNTATVNLKQLIFDGGRVGAQIQAARYSTSAARLQLQRQVQTVLFDVSQSYYQALQARHQLVAAQDSLRLAQTQLRLVEAQFRAGVAAQADVLTAQLPVAQAQLAVAQAANGEHQQIAALLNVMGVPSGVAVTLQDDTSVGGSIPAAADVLAIASNSRPDLLAARESTRSAAAAVRAARAQNFPNISATASEGVSGTNGGGSGNTYSVGVGLSVPIFDGGLIGAQTKSAQAQLETAQANERTAELAVSLTVQQAFLGLQTAQAGLTSAVAELSQARTVLSVTNAQYRAGVTTLPLLLNAQVGLTKAETDYAVALYTFKIAQQQILLAEGTIGSP